MKMNNNKSPFSTLIIIIILILGLISYIVITRLVMGPIQGKNNPTNNKDTSSIPVKVTYDPSKSDQLVKISEDRPKLQSNDQTIRGQLISKSNNDTGIIIDENNYIISYLKPLDIFEVEITSGNVKENHLSATKWFLAQGLSQEGVCKLPVSFYVGFQTDQSIEVNPLPDGC